MNKKALWIVLGVIVIALIAYFAMSRQANSPALVMDSTSSTPIIGQQSLEDLVLAGKPVKCEFDDLTNKSSGTIYVADKRMRGDFTSVNNDQTMTSHVISDNDISYIWQEGETSGFKMKKSEEEEQPEVSNDTSVSSEQPQGFDMDEKLDYKCSPWSVDNSVFSLPSTVDFKDLSIMIPVTADENNNIKVENQTPTDLKTMQCAACDSAPAESRAQCKAALGCE